MEILIKFNKTEVLWLVDPTSDAGSFPPNDQTDLGKIDRSQLKKLLRHAEAGEYKARGISAEQHARHIARELALIEPKFPKTWPAEIEVSDIFAQALQLSTPRVTIADWVQRFSKDD